MAWKPHDYNSVCPHLIVPRAAKVIEFLQSAFDASFLRRFDREDGSTAHAEVRIDDSVVMMGGPWKLRL